MPIYQAPDPINYGQEKDSRDKGEGVSKKCHAPC